jgi:hypothetical protein
MKVDIFTDRVMTCYKDCPHELCEQRGVILNFSEDIQALADKNKKYPFVDFISSIKIECTHKCEERNNQ